MKKLALIDHSFHIKSTATRFFLELLKTRYRVHVYWDYSWHEGAGIDFNKINNNNYDAVVFFQMLNHTPWELLIIKCKNIILVPMYDNVYRLDDFNWLKFYKFKIINFSQTLHNRLTYLDISSKYFQYFPKPAKTRKQKFSELRGFFWQRTDYITWEHIQKLIGNTSFKSFHIHNAVDPHEFNFVKPGKDEIKRYNITISKWFKNQEDYFSVIKEANVYFAPRLHEGIGMSFLEAMAMGKCVVAPDNPTMNEYITHGVNGYLYNPKDPQAIDFSNAKEVAQNALSSIEQGYERWSQSKEELLSFINEEKKEKRIPFMIMLIRMQTIACHFFSIEFFKDCMRKYFPKTAKKLYLMKSHFIQLISCNRK